ncbi:hypothetical protein TPA0909_08030 [Streptomyces albus]|nr:hypothetical protein TPA0909_08030 [Streptomyces albus]
MRGQPRRTGATLALGGHGEGARSHACSEQPRPRELRESASPAGGPPAYCIGNPAIPRQESEEINLAAASRGIFWPAPSQ